MTTVEIADYLVKEFNKNGMLILRYDARSTNSVYLKLDYGVVGSIRISDHIGFKNLHYTFNVECGRTENDIIEDDGHLRYYYGDTMEMLDQLVKDAVVKKAGQWKRFGGKKYAEIMNRNLKDGMNQDYYKFWHRARLV